MDPKILVLVVVSVLAVAPESTKAATPAFCNELPIPVFPDETNVEKWAYNHKQNKCSKFLWGGDTRVRNFFDTETECLKTCQSEKSQATKPWIVVGGRCLCRCPKCKINGTVVQTKSNTKGGAGMTSTTTEASLLKNFFGI